MNPWFPGTEPRASGFRLFCFPYAGGSGAIYRGWQRFLPGVAEVVPVEIPGRGGRRTEPAFRRFAGLIPELAHAVRPFLSAEFAFYGHSMGAVIAFELARELRRRGIGQPRHLFVSGRQAPQLSDIDPITYNLPEPEFIAELRRLNGTPQEVLDHAELMELMLPILRADFELIQTYDYTDGAPLECPIDVYGGAEDHEVPRDVLAGWREQTSAAFALHILPGDHFFIRSSQNQLLQMVASELLKIKEYHSAER